MQNNKNNKDSKNFQKFLSELDIGNVLKVEEDLGSGYVRLKISEAERRQALQDIKCMEDIVVELLRNSRDAKSRNIFIGTSRTSTKRIIHFIDDGVGIPPNLHNLIFESRVTSKLEDGISDPYGFHGRGMALFSIKLNVEDIKITYSDTMKGTSIYLEANLDKIPEKRDQSILPKLIENDGKIETKGGVNNIIKTLIDFNLQNEDIDIFYGTPAQILATMRRISGKEESDYSDYPEFDDWEDFYNYVRNNRIKVTQIPKLVGSYNLMEEVATRIFNMSLSTRTVQRIVYNEIIPLEPVGKNYLNKGGKDLGYVDLKQEKQDETHHEEKGVSSDGLKSNKCRSNLESNLRTVGKNNYNGIDLYDELKLTGRFKDEELRCIINAVEDKVREIGNKYFIVPGNIEIKKVNNTLKILIELKEKN